jgi:4-alpha-glucanotransferase
MDPKMMRRGSGILLHPTCLPGPFGIGDFGSHAFRFIDFLRAAGQGYWQILPLVPSGKGNSPYYSPSAFAGNPLLISPEKLAEHGYLSKSVIANISCGCSSKVDFPAVHRLKGHLLRTAFANFEETSDYCAFALRNDSWLAPYCEFMARKGTGEFKSWTQLDPACQPTEVEMQFHKFVQYEFFRQWSELRNHCRECGISVIGDLPFCIAHDSADVWANREFFNLDNTGEASFVSGVPPDYFSPSGQLWGTPTYRWDRLRETDFKWWIDRLRHAAELTDIVRLDHFRGFESFWEVPVEATTAEHGRWVSVPGAKLFETASRELGNLPFVAENLGVITPAVEDLRRRFGFPGMAVLQFAFGDSSTHRPHTYSRDTLACTGTHDNDTLLGWWRLGGADDLRTRQERERAANYLGICGEEVTWTFIRAIATSVAGVVVIPLQDVLGLGSEARMNVPGIPTGNWGWRYSAESVTNEMVRNLRIIAELSDR